MHAVCISFYALMHDVCLEFYALVHAVCLSLYCMCGVNACRMFMRLCIEHAV